MLVSFTFDLRKNIEVWLSVSTTIDFRLIGSWFSVIHCRYGYQSVQSRIYFLVFGFKIAVEELFLDECLLKCSGDHFGVNLSEYLSSSCA